MTHHCATHVFLDTYLQTLISVFLDQLSFPSVLLIQVLSLEHVFLVLLGSICRKMLLSVFNLQLAIALFRLLIRINVSFVELATTLIVREAVWFKLQIIVWHSQLILTFAQVVMTDSSYLKVPVLLPQLLIALLCLQVEHVLFVIQDIILKPPLFADLKQ